MEERAQWLKWAMELQALAQAGLEYGHDKYDFQRFEPPGLFHKNPANSGTSV